MFAWKFHFLFDFLFFSTSRDIFEESIWEKLMSIYANFIGTVSVRGLDLNGSYNANEFVNKFGCDYWAKSVQTNFVFRTCMAKVLVSLGVCTLELSTPIISYLC